MLGSGGGPCCCVRCGNAKSARAAAGVAFPSRPMREGGTPRAGNVLPRTPRQWGGRLDKKWFRPIRSRYRSLPDQKPQPNLPGPLIIPRRCATGKVCQIYLTVLILMPDTNPGRLFYADSWTLVGLGQGAMDLG